MTEKRERVAAAVARMDDPALAVAKPGDLVVFVMPPDTDPDVMTEAYDELTTRRPAGVEFMLVCGPRVVVVEGGGA